MSKKLDELNARIDALTPRVAAVEEWQATHGDDPAAIAAAEAAVTDLEARVKKVEDAESESSTTDVGSVEVAPDPLTLVPEFPAGPTDPETATEQSENAFVV